MLMTLNTMAEVERFMRWTVQSSLIVSLVIISALFDQNKVILSSCCPSVITFTSMSGYHQFTGHQFLPSSFAQARLTPTLLALSAPWTHTFQQSFSFSTLFAYVYCLFAYYRSPFINIFTKEHTDNLHCFTNLPQQPPLVTVDNILVRTIHYNYDNNTCVYANHQNSIVTVYCCHFSNS